VGHWKTIEFMKTTKANTGLLSRRQFVATSGAAALGAVVAAPLIRPSATWAANSDTLKVGLVGCGGRGSGAALNALMADENVVLTALGDAFKDRIDGCLKNLGKNAKVGARVRVQPDHCFVGLDAYRKVIDSGVDVVLLASPPGFRPEHLKAAVAAGKHIFTEKPMATDAPGVRAVQAAAEEARRRRLSLVSGFCWRYNLAERAGFQQVHDGAVGEVRTVYSTYNTGTLWSRPRQPGWTDLEYQVRNWYYYTWLSGDHLVEQAVHSIDKMIWAMKDEPPARATAHGGRQVRVEPDFGHIYDHFAVVYEWASGAKGFLFCRQQDNCSNDNSDTILGARGVARVLGFRGPPEIKGEKNWRYEGPRPDMYQVEHNELFASIRAGRPMNDGTWMTNTTLMAIMGRMAAYTGQTITWEQALNSKENLAPALDWNGKLPTPPVAMPGKTPFV